MFQSLRGREISVKFAREALWKSFATAVLANLVVYYRIGFDWVVFAFGLLLIAHGYFQLRRARQKQDYGQRLAEEWTQPDSNQELAARS